VGKVLSAHGSGYLPFCITPASTIPQENTGTYYPFSLTLNQLVSLFWRVKKWTYEDNLGLAGAGFSLFVNYPDGPGLQDLPGDEEGLVCIDSYIYFNNFYRSGGSISRIGDFELFSGSVLKVAGFYYPKFFFSGSFDDPNIPIDGNGFSAGGGTGNSQDGTFTISWLGYNVSAPLYGNTGVATFVPKLTAQEYWSYDGTYDTSTGALL